ncbi:hypothetical protein TNCT_249091 [Trichonephila clavata]|uniref:Uncharacterized protein n=1 Tax=Trichonephila clavata TaxID=2740835 RepID=A0A8X6JBF4_TRICU|nr:hypothetical protein TNCT_249091 [Trichonephila clavata]
MINLINKEKTKYGNISNSKKKSRRGERFFTPVRYFMLMRRSGATTNHMLIGFQPQQYCGCNYRQAISSKGHGRLQLAVRTESDCGRRLWQHLPMSDFVHVDLL